jgi:hypothetical protein
MLLYETAIANRRTEYNNRLGEVIRDLRVTIIVALVT